MRLVLDSNEYVLAFGDPPDPLQQRLIDRLTIRPGEHRLLISRLILEEVRRNLTPDQFADVWELLGACSTVPIEAWEIPAAISEKYLSFGFKPGDAAIAACAETSGADAIITENTDFHGRSGLPFAVWRAAEFLQSNP